MMCPRYIHFTNVIAQSRSIAYRTCATAWCYYSIGISFTCSTFTLTFRRVVQGNEGSRCRIGNGVRLWSLISDLQPCSLFVNILWVSPRLPSDFDSSAHSDLYFRLVGLETSDAQVRRWFPTTLTSIFLTAYHASNAVVSDVYMQYLTPPSSILSSQIIEEVATMASTLPDAALLDNKSVQFLLPNSENYRQR